MKLALLSLLLAGQGFTMVGRPAPEVVVERPSEEQPGPHLSDFKGKVIALLFFQTTCGSCHRTGFPLFQAIEKKLGADPDLVTVYIQSPFEMLALNVAAAGAATVKLFGVKGIFLQDRKLPGSIVPATFSRYRADGTPWVVFVDRAGVVQFAGYPELERGMIARVEKLLSQRETSK